MRQDSSQETYPHEVFFTAPWDPVAVRRGDALGLRALTDELAELLAPGLSNRTEDLRWVTILCWCLYYSNLAWNLLRQNTLTGRRFAQERYAWLRPLELMWIARTQELAMGEWRGRQLPGQRSVASWLENNRRSSRFGLSPDQYGRYRQTGVYGAYRVAFRRWPGLSGIGDGWTPGTKCTEFAKFVQDKLGVAQLKIGTRLSSRIWQGRQDEWWLKTWSTFDRGSKRSAQATLPRRRDDFSPLEEADLIKPLLFGAVKQGNHQNTETHRRRNTVQVAATSSAGSHESLCDHLARNLRCDFPGLVILPDFTRLADAGMELMDAIFAALRDATSPNGLTVGDLIDRRDIRNRSSSLRAMAKRWVGRSHRDDLRHVQAAHDFARSVHVSSNDRCVQELVSYHERKGGGVRWFVFRGGRVVPNIAVSDNSTARYRFRLWSLCRMAVQCRQIRSMPRALKPERRAEPGLLEDESD
jgi:hypothetical protein